MRVKKIRAFCSEQHHAWLRTMSESAVREIRLLRSMCGNGVMADPLRHRQTKGAATDMVDLTPPRHIPTLPNLAARSRSRERPESAQLRRVMSLSLGPDSAGQLLLTRLQNPVLRPWRRRRSARYSGCGT